VRNASRKLTTIFANDICKPEEVIDCIFPFDPYKLKKSGEFVRPLYFEYEPLAEDEIPLKTTTKHNRKRTRNESTSCNFEEFLVNKKQKID